MSVTNTIDHAVATGAALRDRQQVITWGDITWGDAVMSGITYGNLIRKEDTTVSTPAKYLYNVIVVNMLEVILVDEKVVATSSEDANFKLDLHKTLKEKGVHDLNTVTIIHRSLGTIKTY